jgi:hypothetical protein
MIAFITSQYNSMHDALIDHFIQAVQSANHSALSNFRETHFEDRKNQGKGIRSLLHTLDMDVFSFINNLENTLQNDRIGSDRKVSRMKNMFDVYKKQTPKIQSQIKDIEHDLREVYRDSGFFDALETKSRSLQRKVTKIVCSMEVDPDSANRKLMFAIDYFKFKHGKITDLCPMGFLSSEEQDQVYDCSDKFRVSLFKIMLFRHIMTSIKSGTLNMKHSFKYRSLEEYLLPKGEWESSIEEILDRASMSHLLDFDTVFGKLKEILDKQYAITNENIISEKNDQVKFNNKGEVIVTTPKVVKPKEDQVPDLFSHLNFVPIQEVLLSINEHTRFLDSFEHFSAKYHRKKPEPTHFIAANIALGCNVGTGKIQKTAKGLERIDLANIIKLYFCHHNIMAANEKS